VEKSHVHTVADASPRPSLTRTVISSFLITRWPSSSVYDSARPPLSTTMTSSSAKHTRDGSRSARPALPIAQTMRPRLGSEAKNAVLTSGECAIASATRRHSSLSRPSSTEIVMNLVAPSPSRTIACASSVATASIASQIAAKRGSPSSEIGGMAALPVAAITKLSLVDVSPSTVAQLKDAAAISRVAWASSRGVIGASVAMNDSIVAMSGWIIPEPFAMPVMVTGTPSIAIRREAPFGTVSVVMIADTAWNQ
jgi:hypothetical protein